jgi:CubicO group peptidase (beta-lactamase class C family)
MVGAIAHTLLVATPAVAAPDEAGYGAAGGYPHGDRSNWFRQEHLVGAQSAMEKIFPVRPVKAGSVPRPLPAADKPFDWPRIDQYLATHPATGLLILKDGKVLAERYQYGRTANDRFTSWSMAKTIVGMAMGAAVADGRIASIEDPVDKYEPALASSAWKGVPIRHVLNMSSGVKFDETYDRPDTDIARLSRPWTRGEGSLLEALQRIADRDAAPGDRFRYVSADTQVLAQVLAKATGKRLADYVGERLWGPLGAEADAAWIVDGTGMEAAYCCLSARLRDWARVGLALQDDGVVDGKRLLPEGWVEAGTTVRFRDGHLQPRRATPYFGYGYQTWVFPDHMGFALLGVRGQAVFVHPRLKLVMVQTAVWPRSSDPDLGRARTEFWRDLVHRAQGM